MAEIAVAHGGGSQPDAHGQAALLLVESLIHGLIATSTISVAEAVDIVDVAASVGGDGAADGVRSFGEMRASLVLLRSMSRSLMQEMPRK